MADAYQKKNSFLALFLSETQTKPASSTQEDVAETNAFDRCSSKLCKAGTGIRTPKMIGSLTRLTCVLTRL